MCKNIQFESTKVKTMKIFEYIFAIQSFCCGVVASYCKILAMFTSSLTVKEAREKLYTYIVPKSNGPTDAKVIEYLNEAQQLLINSGKIPNTVKTVDYTNGYGFITLPRRCLSALGTQFNGIPRMIYNQWHEFVSGGPGRLCDSTSVNSWPWNQNSQLQDMGDGFVTFRDSPYEEFYLRVKINDVDDVDKIIYLKGNDADGNPLFSVDSDTGFAFEGVKLTTANPSVTSTETFTTIYGFEKPTTQAYLTLWAVDVDTAEETMIGNYEPTETNPSYRRYRIALVNEVASVRVSCKMRYVPCVSETDYVFPDNIPALKAALMSLRYRDQDDLEREAEYFGRALQIINNEMKEQRGGEQYVAQIIGAPAMVSFY